MKDVKIILTVTRFLRNYKNILSSFVIRLDLVRQLFLEIQMEINLKRRRRGKHLQVTKQNIRLYYFNIYIKSPLI